MTTLTTNPAATLHRLVRRVGLTLALARNVAMVAAAAAVLAAGVMLLAAVDRWLIPLPHGLSGGGVLILAGMAAWLVERRLAASRARPERLTICLRLEQAMPAIGERLSRAIGLTPLPTPPTDADPTVNALQQNLRDAALADATAALQAIPLAGWLRTQPEVRAAAWSALAAGLAWAALSVSWAAGPAAWRTSLAVQFWEPPTVKVSGPPPAAPPATNLSLEQATLAVYRQTVAEHATWREPGSTTRDMTIEMQRLAGLADAASVQAEWHRGEASAEALVLTALADGLHRAAESAAAGEPPSHVGSHLGDLIAIARAAAGLAEAAATLHDASRVVATSASASAGLAGDELPVEARAWRAAISQDLTMIATGIKADQDLLVSRDVLPNSMLPPAIGGDTTTAVEQNRLFSAARDLDVAAGSLDATVLALGMPPLPERPTPSLAAAARRRLASLAATRRIDSAIQGDGSQQPPGREPGAAQPPPDVAVAIAVDGPPGEAVTPNPAASDQTAAAGGQPAAGGTSGSTGSAEFARPRGGSTGSSSVWIPRSTDGEASAPLPPTEREPAASPGYFRRLLEQTTQSLRRTVSSLLTAAVRGTVVAAVTAAEDAAATEASPPANERAPADQPPPDAGKASTAVDRGVQWLVDAQQPDGSWGSQRFRGSVAVTAHGLLALASTGSTALAGPHAPAAERALSFLLQQAAGDGLITGNEASAHGPMYGHAYAIQALAELSGEAGRPEVAATLRRGCRLIEQTQNDQGGWRYQPRRADADISVTAAVLVALESAAAAGIDVSDDTVERAAAYILALQNTDGGFRYQKDAGPSAPARTAAALVALALTRPDQREPLAAGRRWLTEHPLAVDPSDGYAAYGILASSTAAWQAGPDAWATWYAATAKALLAAQQPDGSWADPSCAEYGTAAAILSLTTANGLLPAWKRGATP